MFGLMNLTLNWPVSELLPRSHQNIAIIQESIPVGYILTAAVATTWGGDRYSPLDNLPLEYPFHDTLSSLGYPTSRYPTPWNTLPPDTLPHIPYLPRYLTPGIPYSLGCPTPWDTLPTWWPTLDTLLPQMPYPPDNLPQEGPRNTLPPWKDIGPEIPTPCEQTDTCENITFPHCRKLVQNLVYLTSGYDTIYFKC